MSEGLPYKRVPNVCKVYPYLVLLNEFEPTSVKKRKTKMLKAAKENLAAYILATESMKVSI